MITNSSFYSLSTPYLGRVQRKCCKLVLRICPDYHKDGSSFTEKHLQCIGVLAAQECCLIHSDMLGNPYNKQLYDTMPNFQKLHIYNCMLIWMHWEQALHSLHIIWPNSLQFSSDRRHDLTNRLSAPAKRGNQRHCSVNFNVPY